MLLFLYLMSLCFDGKGGPSGKGKVISLTYNREMRHFYHMVSGSTSVRGFEVVEGGCRCRAARTKHDTISTRDANGTLW